MVNASCVLQRSVSPAGCRVVMCSTGGRVAVAAPASLQNSAPLPHPPSVSQIPWNSAAVHWCPRRCGCCQVGRQEHR